MKLPPLAIHVIALLLAVFAAVSTAQAGAPPPGRAAQLMHLLRQDCGSCHGLTMKGGLGPALLPETLREKPVDGLVQTVLHGRAGTAMPGWAPFMSEAEAGWLVSRLLEGLPGEETR